MHAKNLLSFFSLLIFCLVPFITQDIAQAQDCDEHVLSFGNSESFLVPGSGGKGASESYVTSTQDGVIRKIQFDMVFLGNIQPTAQISLTHLKSGRTVALTDGETENELIPFQALSFFDEADNSVKDWGALLAPVPFSARPVGSLSDFDGLTTNTSWRLSVVDTTGNSDGEIESWQFYITTGLGSDGDGDGYNTCIDCDDSNPDIFPGAVELEDGLDNDCDTIIDNVFIPAPDPIANTGLASVPPKLSKLVVRANILKNKRKVKVRRGGTLKVAFDEALEQENATSLEVDLGNNSLVIQDGGTERDAKKGDGVFSSKVPNVILAEIRSRVERIIKIKSNKNLNTYVFEGRHLVSKPEFDLSYFNLRVNNRKLAISKIVGKKKNVNRAVKKVMDKVYKMGRPLKKSSRFRSINLSFSEAKLDINKRPPPPPSVAVDSEKSLLIRDLNVVNDATRTVVWKLVGGVCTPTGNVDGVWSFKTLMKEMANTSATGISTHKFVNKWLIDGWQSNWNVNGNTVGASYQGIADMLQYWPKTLDLPGGIDDELVLQYAPFQLIAIVNRLDLRGSLVYGGNSGQLRFVFAFINPMTCQPEEGNIIFEYRNLAVGCSTAKSLANDWLDLSLQPLGSASYNQALENLTLPVTSANAVPAANNGSALLQLRTNERIVAWPHYPFRNWELRDFVIDSNGVLVPDPVDQTPVNSAYYLNGITTYRQFPDPAALNNSSSCGPIAGLPPFPDPALINTYIDANIASLNLKTHNIAKTYNGGPLLGGFAIYGNIFTGNIFCGTGYQEGNSHWGDSSVSNVEARHEFSVNSCNGCHAREVFDDAGANSVQGAPNEEKFRHIKLASLGTPAVLSRFMTGTDVSCTGNLLVPPLGTNSCAAGCCPIGDAAFGSSVAQYHFNELKRRAIMLDNTASNSCLTDMALDSSDVPQSAKFVH